MLYNDASRKARARDSGRIEIPIWNRGPVRKLCLFVCILLVSCASEASDLQKKLDQMAASYHGRVALYARNLTTGDSVALDPNRPVQTASVIKLPLMLQAFEQVKAGKLHLSDPVVLTKDNQVQGSGVLQFMDPGLRLTLKDAITLMMILSDNTATNMVIDAVGLKPTNAMLARMGMKNTYFYKKVFKPATEPMPPDQKKFGLGKTTAEEMAKVLESIYRCDMGDRALCLGMITIMRNQQYQAMIPRYLQRKDTSEDLSAIADKVGELDDVRNDVALVYTTRGPVIISIFTYDNQDQSWTPENKAEILIGRMAEAIVNAWAPGGLAPTVSDPIAPAR
jgi:beta-lactamase class A